MSAQITLDWKKDSTFETQMDGHTVTIDTSKEDGGTGSGVRPKALMLVALAGCSGVNVIFYSRRCESVLKNYLSTSKQKQPIPCRCFIQHSSSLST